MLFGNCICNCFCFVSLFVLHSLTVKSLLVITNTAVPYIAVPLPSSDVESLNGVYATIHVQHTCSLQPACPCTAWRMHVLFSMLETCAMNVYTMIHICRTPL